MTRFRFSVRTMLIVVAVLAIPLGWAAMRLKTGRDKGRAIANLRAMGVSIVMDGYQDASPMVPPWVRELFGWQSVGIALGVDSNDVLSKLDGMHNLKALGFLGDVSNSGLKLLGGMPQLKSLGLHGEEVWKKLPTMPHIETFDVSHTTISAKQLSQHLRSLPQLKFLSLSYTPMVDEDLAALA